MKSKELAKLLKKLTDDEKAFYEKSEAQIVKNVGKNSKVIVSNLNLYTQQIRNDDGNPYRDEFEWYCDAICVNKHGEVTVTCEECDFDLEDFTRDSIVRIVKYTEDA